MIWIYTFHTDSLFLFSDANIAQMVDMKIIRKDKDPRFGKAPCICLLKECVCKRKFLYCRKTTLQLEKNNSLTGEI